MLAYRWNGEDSSHKVIWGFLPPLCSQNSRVMEHVYSFRPWPAAQVPSGVISLFFHDHKFHFRMFSKAISRNCTKYIELTLESRACVLFLIMSQNRVYFWIQWFWKKHFLWFIFFKIIFRMFVHSVFCVSHFLLRVLGLQMTVIPLYLFRGLWRFVLCSLGFHGKCFDPLTCLWIVPIFISCLSTPEL